MSMKLVATLAYILFCAVCTSALSAQELNIDWKFYGGASVDRDHSRCFYDAKGIVRGPQGQIRVWTKCILQKDMDSIDVEKDFDGKILELTAQKVAHYYVPPIARLETIDVDQSMTITQYKETANIANIQPHASIFYELNCPERMLRELSIYVQANGKSGSRNKPGDWKHVPPEGNGARLIRLLCPVK
jgi:hypothetical protein